MATTPAKNDLQLTEQNHRQIGVLSSAELHALGLEYHIRGRLDPIIIKEDQAEGGLADSKDKGQSSPHHRQAEDT